MWNLLLYITLSFYGNVWYLGRTFSQFLVLEVDVTVYF